MNTQCNGWVLIIAWHADMHLQVTCFEIGRLITQSLPSWSFLELNIPLHLGAWVTKITRLLLSLAIHSLFSDQNCFIENKGIHTASCECTQNDHWENNAYTALLHPGRITMFISLIKPSSLAGFCKSALDHFLSSKFKYFCKRPGDFPLSHTTYHSFDSPSSTNGISSLLCSGNGSRIPALLKSLFRKTSVSISLPFRPVLLTSTLGEGIFRIEFEMLQTDNRTCSTDCVSYSAPRSLGQPLDHHRRTWQATGSLSLFSMNTSRERVSSGCHRRRGTYTPWVNYAADASGRWRWRRNDHVAPLLRVPGCEQGGLPVHRRGEWANIAQVFGRIIMIVCGFGLIRHMSPFWKALSCDGQ